MFSWVLIIFGVSLMVQPGQPLFDTVKTGFKAIYNTLENLVTLPVGIVKFLVEEAVLNHGELKNTDVKNGSEFDFIVIGAGSAGAAVAGRLAEVKDIKILLIDAGHRENLFFDIPLAAPYLLFHNFWNWHYNTESSPNFGWAMKNNELNFMRGKITGGTSAVNFMIATRGHPKDYDLWAEMGNEGWSYKDVLPFFKKMENASVEYEESDLHGHSGPVNIVNPSPRTSMARAFIEAGNEMGFPSLDYNGKEQISFSPLQTNLRNGERLTSNRAYLHPVKNNKNLVFTRNSHVDKIVIDPSKMRATGVLYTKGSKTILVHARKEIILSAGPINSPQILMLSGIGPAEHLRKFNIPVIKDLKVGENLLDHMTVLSSVVTVDNPDTIVTTSLIKPSNKELSKYLNDRKGIFSLPGGVEAIGYVDSKNLSVRTGGPDIEICYDSVSVNKDPIAYRGVNIRTDFWNRNFGPYKHENSFIMLPTLLQPKSTGKILLRSGNPKDKPRILPNYYSVREDVETFIRGIRVANSLLETKAMKKYNASVIPIKDCFKYGKYDTDEYWECVIRTVPFTFWHICGTCKMGPKIDKGAVVDARLKVYGMEGLRVADTSIFPYIPRAHLNVPGMMLGEKAAHMIKEDHKLLAK